MPDSFDYTTGTNSEDVRLLQALIDEAPEYTEETNSRNANILKSIINNTEYTDAPQSEIEELLLRLKAKIGGEIEVDELNVTENGTYDAGVNKAYNPVNVELPLDSKTITENGTYTASDDNLAGYNEVTVAVEGYAKKSIANTPTPIATFNASALPMPSLTVGIEATQSGNGDPSPTNVRPITGFSAVNVYDNDGNWWDEQYEIYGSGATARIGSKNPIPCKGGFTYYITKNPAYGWKFYDSNMNVLLTWYNQTCTAPQNACFMSFQLDDAYGTTYNNDVCINTVSTTYYVPYNGTTYTTALKDGQGNPMTCYGGTLDVVSGVMTLTHEYVDMGTLNWSKNSATVWAFTNLSGVKAPANNDTKANIICSNYKTVTGNQAYLKTKGVAINASNLQLVVYDEAYADAPTFKTAMSGVQLVYELATPITIQLTPTAVKSLLGTNNIWADSGNVLSGEYMEAL